MWEETEREFLLHLAELQQLLDDASISEIEQRVRTLVSTREARDARYERTNRIENPMKPKTRFRSPTPMRAD